MRVKLLLLMLMLLLLLLKVRRRNSLKMVVVMVVVAAVFDVQTGNAVFEEPNFAVGTRGGRLVVVVHVWMAVVEMLGGWKIRRAGNVLLVPEQLVSLRLKLLGVRRLLADKRSLKRK
jgi:hypothetical protein